MSQINIKHIANLNSESLRGLAFYEQELGFLQERLDEISGDNTGKEVSEKVEHFGNQLIIHKDVIDELKHLIHANNKSMGSQLHHTDVFVDRNSADEHQQLNEKYGTEEKMFNDFRYEFNRFAAKWM
ncbi:MAG: hypothetical protein JWP37_1594 [Mucilaginibacter sp.]|nr:hypothetical protein [Mucilaginibacter sp.]